MKDIEKVIKYVEKKIKYYTLSTGYVCAGAHELQLLLKKLKTNEQEEGA